MTYNLIKFTKGLDILAIQHVNDYGIVEKITDIDLNDIEVTGTIEAYTISENIDISQPIDPTIY